MKFDAINYPNGKIEIPPFIEEEGLLWYSGIDFLILRPN